MFNFLSSSLMSLFSDMIPKGLDIPIQVSCEDTKLLILSSSPSLPPAG